MNDMTAYETRVAVLNVTWGGQNGNLADAVPYDLSDAEIRRVAAEAVSSGAVPGVSSGRADFSGFVVDRYPATEALPDRIFLRPKTEYGA